MMNSLKYDKVPKELKSLRQWVCYKLIIKDGKTRADKIPICPCDGSFAKSNDIYTWDTFYSAIEAAEKYSCDGIGIMFGNGICGVDIDHCLEDGETTAMAQDIIDRLNSYTEISPSGTGIHILCKGQLPKESGRRNQEGLEMYDTGRFFTVTGNAYYDEDGEVYPLKACTEELAAVHREYIYKPAPEQLSLNKVTKPIQNTLMNDEEILKIAIEAKNGDKFKDLLDGRWQNYNIGDGSQSSADQAFCNLLAFWFNCDESRMDTVFRRSGLFRDKWDKHRGALTYGEKTIKSAIRDCMETFQPQNKEWQDFKGLPQPPPTPPPKKQAEPKPPITDEIEIEEAPTKKYSYDDTGNAIRFRDMFHADIKYNHIDKIWLHWDGKRWTEDKSGEIKRKADLMLIEMQEEINEKIRQGEYVDEKYQKHINRSRSSKGKKAFIEEAQHLDDIPIMPWELDKYQNIMNLQNCVLNLKTGEVREHNRIYKLSQLGGISYNKDAKCPTWVRFIDDITDHNGELALYIQRMVGYCMTGITSEQCAFFLYGTGKNGKSTFLNIISEIMGEYSKNAAPETVMMRANGNSSSARSDIARLRNARLVTTFEPNQDSRLDEGMVKQMTGQDVITARALYKSEFEFRPEFKIVVATNYKPIIKGTDVGIWRRIKLVPFVVHIPSEKRDKNLPVKLREEFSGILNWIIEGAVGWYNYGLPQCFAVDEAVREYQHEMDKIQQFIDDCIVVSSHSSLQAMTIYETYKAWTEEQGDRYPLSATKFFIEMKKRYECKKTSLYNEYLGIEYSDKATQLMANKANIYSKYNN